MINQYSLNYELYLTESLCNNHLPLSSETIMLFLEQPAQAIQFTKHKDQTMQRRHLIKWICTSVLALTSSRAFSINNHFFSDKIALVKFVYPPTDAARNVGKRCFESQVPQHSINQLFELAGINNATTPDQLVQAFESRRKADFENGNTEIVDGWVLARAEASMIAILSQI